VHRLQTSPVSWLGGNVSSQPSRDNARLCQKQPLLGCVTSDLSQWPASFLKCNLCRVDFQARPTSSSATLARSRGRERLPPYSRAAATDFFFVASTRSGPTNRLPEHEVRGECGLRNCAAGLGWTRKTAANNYVPDETVTRGRPLAHISTLSGVWKTCSSNSR
jgi:hypothetical protein